MVAATTVAAEPLQPPSADWFPQAPPLPPPAGGVIRVKTVDELYRAAEEVKPGDTIFLADGQYMMPRYFDLRTDNVTLRGESGRRECVILDGANSRHDTLLAMTGCAGVTIANLTIQNVQANGFKINSDKFTTRVTIYNCIAHNIWQRAVKGPAVKPEDRDRFRPSDCRIQYCLFYNDRPKQYSDDPADGPGRFDGNYVGGIDVMYARRWTISDNVFIGIQGRTREARGAVFLWHEAEDCVVERNIIIDCDCGICLGNSHRPDDVQAHCRRCVVRNNFVVRCPENGILADYTQDCKILHNSIHDPGARLKRLIRLVHDNEGLDVAHNLLSGPPMRVETASRVKMQNNVTRELTTEFVAAEAGNLRLKSPVAGIVDAGERRPDVPDDIDRQARDEKPDIGADEFSR